MPSKNTRTEKHPHKMDITGSQRYLRQTMLDDWGSRGQERLARSSILIAGAGGLGSILCLYMAAAGIGRILIADHDTLELSNLNRQVIHDESGLGKEKAALAAQKMNRLNSTINTIPLAHKLTPATIRPLMEKTDLVLDGTDNYQTRQVINRACLNTGVSWIYGGVTGFDGMVSFFRPGRTACFECIIKPPGSPGSEPPGVAGPAAGITASLQAMAALRYLLGHETGLENRLLCFSGTRMQTHPVTLSPDPQCPACRSFTAKKERKT